jgi:hypothetical protein
MVVPKAHVLAVGAQVGQELAFDLQALGALLGCIRFVQREAVAFVIS